MRVSRSECRHKQGQNLGIWKPLKRPIKTKKTSILDKVMFTEIDFDKTKKEMLRTSVKRNDSNKEMVLSQESIGNKAENHEGSYNDVKSQESINDDVPNQDGISDAVKSHDGMNGYTEGQEGMNYDVKSQEGTSNEDNDFKDMNYDGQNGMNYENISHDDSVGVKSHQVTNNLGISNDVKSHEVTSGEKKKRKKKKWKSIFSQVNGKFDLSSMKIFKPENFNKLRRKNNKRKTVNKFIKINVLSNE